MDKSKSCMNCKFFYQGSSNSYCGHINASLEEKKYRYYNFGCDDKFVFGECEQRKEWYNKLPKEEKKVFEDMKSWDSQEWFKELKKINNGQI